MGDADPSEEFDMCRQLASDSVRCSLYSFQITSVARDYRFLGWQSGFSLNGVDMRQVLSHAVLHYLGVPSVAYIPNARHCAIQDR